MNEPHIRPVAGMSVASRPERRSTVRKQAASGPRPSVSGARSTDPIFVTAIGFDAHQLLWSRAGFARKYAIVAIRSAPATGRAVPK